MDNIQKIVEQLKAKQDADHKEVSARNAVPRKNGTLVSSDYQAGHLDSLQEIAYEQTKIINTDPSELAERRLIAGLIKDPRSLPFRMLRTQVLHQLRENSWNTLAINGATQGAGKSFVATNLAVSIALEVNQTVLLVDMDLRRPSIHKYFGIDPEYGLLDHLQDDVPINKIMVNPGIERLVIIPGKGSTDEASEIISSPKMLRLVEDMKNRYKSRIIIFDLPPLLSVDDAWVFLPHVDAGLLVVENGKNTEHEVIKSLQILEVTNFIGAVLNKDNEENQSNYYYKY
jgi:protein-tyrosine kinase